VPEFHQLESIRDIRVLRLCSSDGTNRMSRACVLELTTAIRELAREILPLIIGGNHKFFSAGAELSEIAALTGAQAYEFSKMGQELMNVVANFPAPVYAAVEGYCMGGGLDLSLACHHRIASPHAIFGHRGAALGLITGWGGTQRLPRIVGKAKALEMFVAAEKLHAAEAQRIGLVEAVVQDPVGDAVKLVQDWTQPQEREQIPRYARNDKFYQAARNPPSRKT
jgi:enoyl-CoA hydratase/carnithine racemase